MQAGEEAKAAHADKKREKKQGARELEAAHLAFEDIPLDNEQGRMSDEDLRDQRSMLLAHKAASEEVMRMEADHDRVEREKERQAASLREIERHTAEQLELFQRNQEMLRDIASNEQKVRAAKLLLEAGQREAQECDRTLDQLQKQKEALWESLEKRKAEMDAEQD